MDLAQTKEIWKELQSIVGDGKVSDMLLNTADSKKIAWPENLHEIIQFPVYLHRLQKLFPSQIYSSVGGVVGANLLSFKKGTILLLPFSLGYKYANFQQNISLDTSCGTSKTFDSVALK